MKQVLLALVVLVAFVSSSCEKFEELLTFNIKQDANMEVPATPFIVSDPILLPPVKVTASEEFKSNKAKMVKDIVLNKIDLSITNPQNANFDFLKNIEIFISVEGKSDVKVAYLTEVPKGVNTISLNTTNAKLDEYIKADSYTIQTRVTFAKTVDQKTNIKAAMNFKLTADPF
jgi:hypothetical protein